MAVKNICRVINSKNALPILGDVLCMVDEEKQTITMTGADTEAWLTYQLGLQACEGGGRFCIGADLLRDALSELPEETGKLIVDESGHVKTMKRFRIILEGCLMALGLPQRLAYEAQC